MREFLKKNKTLAVTLALIIGVVVTASTVAVLVSTTNTVANTFDPAGVNTRIDEENGVSKTHIMKRPAIVNDGPSNAFVRARITISPSDAGVILYAGEWTGTDENREFEQKSVVFTGKKGFSDNNNWIYNKDDGFYYYIYPVPAPENITETISNETTPLFDAVTLEKNADVTIYQESVLAHSTHELGEEVNVEEIKELFDSVTKE